jgi:hypothetical protein
VRKVREIGQRLTAALVAAQVSIPRRADRFLGLKNIFSVSKMVGRCCSALSCSFRRLHWQRRRRSPIRRPNRNNCGASRCCWLLLLLLLLLLFARRSSSLVLIIACFRFDTPTAPNWTPNERYDTNNNPIRQINDLTFVWEFNVRWVVCAFRSVGRVVAALGGRRMR